MFTPKDDHVTLIHHFDTAAVDEDHVLSLIWEKFSHMAVQRKSPKYTMRFDHLVWDDKVAILTVEDIELVDEGLSEYERALWSLPGATARRFHVRLAL